MTLPPAEQTDDKALLVELDSTINSLTKDCSKPYFGKVLKQLARENVEGVKKSLKYMQNRVSKDRQIIRTLLSYLPRDLRDEFGRIEE